MSASSSAIRDVVRFIAEQSADASHEGRLLPSGDLLDLLVTEFGDCAGADDVERWIAERKEERRLQAAQG